mmetsp:Transcript_38887/g.62070  ORF Transcript_38887/g.62070 Transcript_38887/m.62070 type:complete len:401 (-) Transcript_38887:643-1845(-)
MRVAVIRCMYDHSYILVIISTTNVTSTLLVIPPHSNLILIFLPAHIIPNSFKLIDKLIHCSLLWVIQNRKHHSFKHVIISISQQLRKNPRNHIWLIAKHTTTPRAQYQIPIILLHCQLEHAFTSFHHDSVHHSPRRILPLFLVDLASCFQPTDLLHQILVHLRSLHIIPSIHRRRRDHIAFIQRTHFLIVWQMHTISMLHHHHLRSIDERVRIQHGFLLSVIVIELALKLSERRNQSGRASNRLFLSHAACIPATAGIPRRGEVQHYHAIAALGAVLLNQSIRTIQSGLVCNIDVHALVFTQSMFINVHIRKRVLFRVQLCVLHTVFDVVCNVDVSVADRMHKTTVFQDLFGFVSDEFVVVSLQSGFYDRFLNHSLFAECQDDFVPFLSGHGHIQRKCRD